MRKVNYAKIGTVLFMLSGWGSMAVLADHSDGHVDVNVSQLTSIGLQGQKIFNATCANCHGENGSGSLDGPPLIHDIYNPGHHSNQAIISAIKNGSRQHHWIYGDMPAQPEITFSQIPAIITFIRETQNQNGIESRPHTM